MCAKYLSQEESQKVLEKLDEPNPLPDDVGRIGLEPIVPAPPADGDEDLELEYLRLCRETDWRKKQEAECLAKAKVFAEKAQVEINEVEAAINNVNKANKSALGHAIQAGRYLIEAKKLVPFGGWTRWLLENFPTSLQTARRYAWIYLAGESIPEIGQALNRANSIRDAVRIISGYKDIIGSCKVEEVELTEESFHATACAARRQLEKRIRFAATNSLPDDAAVFFAFVGPGIKLWTDLMRELWKQNIFQEFMNKSQVELNEWRKKREVEIAKEKEKKQSEKDEKKQSEKKVQRTKPRRHGTAERDKKQVAQQKKRRERLHESTTAI